MLIGDYIIAKNYQTKLYELISKSGLIVDEFIKETDAIKKANELKNQDKFNAEFKPKFERILEKLNIIHKQLSEIEERAIFGSNEYITANLNRRYLERVKNSLIKNQRLLKTKEAKLLNKIANEIK